MPVPDACFGLPWLFLNSVGEPHLKSARHGSPHGLWYLLEIEHALEAATVRFHIGVVEVGHDIGREIGDSQPHSEVRRESAAGIKIKLRIVVEIQNVGTVLIDDILNPQ